MLRSKNVCSKCATLLLKHSVAVVCDPTVQRRVDVRRWRSFQVRRVTGLDHKLHGLNLLMRFAWEICYHTRQTL